MRQAPNSRRTRGRSNGTNRRPNLPNRNQTFNSNGPEVRIRGNAYQVYEKYLTLARDATASGDRVMSENYYQHAEHYYRIINAINEAYREADRQSYEQPREAAAREGGGRDNGTRENGHQDGAAHDGAGRENGHRDPGGAAAADTLPSESRVSRSQDGGGRDGAARGNGQAGDQGYRDKRGRDGAQPDIEDPRDSGTLQLDFGADPRQSDDDADEETEDQASLPRTRFVDLTSASPENGAADSAAAQAAAPPDAGEGGEPQRPTRLRRRVQRPRRPALNGAPETPAPAASETDPES